MLGHQQFEDGPGAVRLGHYKVGDKLYYHKMNAIIYASKTKQTVEWDFNSDIFEQQTKKPIVNWSLPDLYKQRAQQLRDNYDYLILAFSGGSDSYNILRTFLDNNIKLDEVWFDQPFKFIELADYKPNYSTDSTNMASEWYFVVKPELDKLQITHPHIKIHVSDSCAPQENETFEDLHTLTLGIGYNSAKRWRYLQNYVRQLGESSGKRVGVVLGVEKCNPWITQGEFGFTFVDPPIFSKFDELELFYWTPEMPELAVTQAHVLWNAIMSNPKSMIERTLARRNPATGPMAWAERDAFDRFVKDALYGNWDHSKHQVRKQKMLFAEGFKPFVDRWQDQRFFQIWHSDMRNLFNSLDKKLIYANGEDPSKDIKVCANSHTIGTLSVNQ